MIPNPSPDYSYVVLNFWPNLSLVVLIKLFLNLGDAPFDSVWVCVWGGGGGDWFVQEFFFHWQVVQTMFYR